MPNDKVREINYIKSDYKYRQHYERFKNRVLYSRDSLPCYECKGMGGEYEIVIGDGGPEPWIECGWCLGTGRTTRWMRGLWLRYKKEQKQHKKQGGF